MDNSTIFGVPHVLSHAVGPVHEQDGDGGDGNSNGGSGDQGSSEAQGRSGSGDVARHLNPDLLIQEHGDAQRALGALSQKAEDLESDNADLRDQRRELREQVPGDDDVVVSADRIDELREEGYLETETPTADDLISALEEERSQRRQVENKQKFARVIDLTGADRGVLEDLGADTLDYQLTEVEGDDGGTKVQVEVETDDGTQEFTEYIEDEYPNLADAILSGDGGSSGGDDDDSGGGSYVPATPGPGSSDDGGGEVTSVDEYLEEENERRGRA
jgi:hypothetical protein